MHKTVFVYDNITDLLVGSTLPQKTDPLGEIILFTSNNSMCTSLILARLLCMYANENFVKIDNKRYYNEEFVSAVLKADLRSSRFPEENKRENIFDFLMRLGLQEDEHGYVFEQKHMMCIESKLRIISRSSEIKEHENTKSIQYLLSNFELYLDLLRGKQRFTDSNGYFSLDELNDFVPLQIESELKRSVNTLEDFEKYQSEFSSGEVRVVKRYIESEQEKVLFWLSVRLTSDSFELKEELSLREKQHLLLIKLSQSPSIKSELLSEIFERLNERMKQDRDARIALRKEKKLALEERKAERQAKIDAETPKQREARLKREERVQQLKRERLLTKESQSVKVIEESRSVKTLAERVHEQKKEGKTLVEREEDEKEQERERVLARRREQMAKRSARLEARDTTLTEHEDHVEQKSRSVERLQDRLKKLRSQGLVKSPNKSD